jgi:6-pyruvoyltetrahydropterin/6-carboxytetrahydropterin synthase
MKFLSTKIIDLGSCAFRQWRADSHCKYIHGYRLLVKFKFGCAGLDDKNWVVDFGGLKDLKATLQSQFDHTLCIAADDPALDTFKNLHNAGLCDLRIFEHGVGIEKFAQYCFNVADELIRTKTVGRCWVESAEVWEHDQNSAIVNYNLGDILPSCRDPKNTTNSDVTNLNTEVHVPADETPAHEASHHSTPRPAAVGNKVTSGWSNPFGGTSWGV